MVNIVKKSKQIGGEVMAKRKNNLKKIVERKHCRKRAQERFGIEFTRDLRENTIFAIKHNIGRMVRKQSNRVSIWEKVVPGHPEIQVVYDKERREIVTVLYKRGDRHAKSF